LYSDEPPHKDALLYIFMVSKGGTLLSHLDAVES